LEEPSGKLPISIGSAAITTTGRRKIRPPVAGPLVERRHFGRSSILAVFVHSHALKDDFLASDRAFVSDTLPPHSRDTPDSDCGGRLDAATIEENE
jgi:hypothetical protein